jgi:type VI secretion system secreted protein Hcp
MTANGDGMPARMFLKLDPAIRGDSTDRDHRDGIIVTSWSWGMGIPVPAAGAAHQPVPRATIQGITIAKWVDKASALLMLACCKRRKFKEGVLEIIVEDEVRADGTRNSDRKETIRITMNDVTIDSITSGGSGIDIRMNETLTLAFTRVKYRYNMTADGINSGNIEFGWDLVNNREF